MTSPILIIDDHPSVGEALTLLLSLHGIAARTATTPGQGLALLASEPFALVIQDMNFSADTTSGDEGAALFAAIRAAHPDLPVILLTAWTQLERAVSLIKAGAADYLAKPWDDVKLLASVRNLMELAESQQVLRQQRQATQRRGARAAALRARADLGGLVVASEAMLALVEMAVQVAHSPLPVLITGANGAGKEGIAHILHANSTVKAGPFVALNCGALPAELIEAELFGAEGGAYTGAQRAREGRFEAADGGTLLLDEIGNLPLAGQMKLLRVLETGEYQRLGSTRTRRAQVRVVSATNADLPAMVAGGTFREDLYYRLNVLALHVLPLAERPDDVLPLAAHFLAADAARLTDAAQAALLAHAWPGNVRELRNALARARLLAADGPIEPAHLMLPTPAPDASRNLSEPGREAIAAALAAHAGNVSRAAAQLGLSRQALYRRMEHWEQTKT
ncbi:MAG: sigma-54 dependent transcriptional regulator [Proteobacteria bacterium]|nr:sigma-54 dependent transcriptional regulator [Pseudomonadota bacterium]